MRNLGKIKLLSAREQVASELRKAILSRKLNQGEEITLDQIASQLGVSSMPVREAFQILDSDGLIKLRPNKGAIVLGVNEKTIRDHYETRAILESEAAAMVCEEGTDISSIEDSFNMANEALKKNDSYNYNEYNQQFHMCIWETAGNKKIESILSSLWNGLSIGVKVTEEDYARISIVEHQRIMNAIKNHDKEEAREAMKEHIKRSMENILTHFSNQ